MCLKGSGAALTPNICAIQHSLGTGDLATSLLIPENSDNNESVVRELLLMWPVSH